MDANQVLDQFFPRVDGISAADTMEASCTGQFISLAQLSEAKAQGLTVRTKTVRVSSLPESLRTVPAQYRRLCNR